MAGRPWNEHELETLRQYYHRVPTGEMPGLIGDRTEYAIKQKAQDLGLSKYEPPKLAPMVESVPGSNRKPEELFDALKSAFRRKEAHSLKKRHGVTVTIPHDGPFAILCFGDPHIGDPGCDIEKLLSDIETVKTEPHVYGLNIGDLGNLWCRKLGHLWAHSPITDDEERALIKYLVGSIPWIMVILGNHDTWTTKTADICRELSKPYMAHGGRLNIRCGDTEFKVYAAHQIPGRSQYHAAFPGIKANYRGLQTDLTVSGHTHQGAESSQTNGTAQVTSRIVNLGAYKRYDDYAELKGFSPDDNGPSCLAVFDPSLDHGDPNRVTVFWNIDRGLVYLNALRSLWESTEEGVA